MGLMLEISTELRAALRLEAAASPHAETCGLLFGSDASISHARTCRNVHPDSARWFELDPASHIAAHRAMRAGGPRLIGWHHSHPSGEPAPSRTDAEAAAPDGMIWLIVTAADVRAWRAVGSGAVHGRFDPVELVASGLRG